MRRISLFMLSQFAGLLSVFGQSSLPVDSVYKSRDLQFEEVNFVSGYYHQDGNNSGVTGGIGTESLTDFANSLELKLTKLGDEDWLHTFSFELGVDHYTSASSGNIDPNPSTYGGTTGPSSQDTRIYPSFSWNALNPQKTVSFGVGASYSHEFDYESRGLSAEFIKTSKDKNREFGVKVMAFFDSWGVILPIELRPVTLTSSSNAGHSELSYDPRNSYQASFTYSQVVNPRLQFALIVDPSYQSGQLSTLYQRVYFTNKSVKAEKLPDNRFKLPIGIRASYFLGDRVVLRGFYRYYKDSWGNKAHTASLEMPVKITPFISISPFYRFNTQSGIDYFAAYGKHTTNETYYTSDYDLSKLKSQLLGVGIRFAPPKGVLGMEHFNSLELRYSHYMRDAGTGLIGNSLTMAMKFK